MRTHDQYFNVGDKVMCVASPDELGLEANPSSPAVLSRGAVYCISYCGPYPPFGNIVHLVGVQHIVGFYAACFRRVSEIQLCVRAAKRLSTTETEEVKV